MKYDMGSFYFPKINLVLFVTCNKIKQHVGEKTNRGI